MNTFEDIRIALEIISVILMPVIMYMLKYFHDTNVGRFDDIKQKLAHQDECIDEMKKDALNIARAANFVRRDDMEIELTRIRVAITSEINRGSEAQVQALTDVRERLRNLEARAMRVAPT